MDLIAQRNRQWSANATIFLLGITLGLVMKPEPYLWMGTIALAMVFSLCYLLNKQEQWNPKTEFIAGVALILILAAGIVGWILIKLGIASDILMKQIAAGVTVVYGIALGMLLFFRR